jgi:putative transposase
LGRRVSRLILKTEWIKDTIYYTKDKARADVVDYIEMFYNSHRLHAFIDYKIPNEFEKQIDLSEAA